MSSQHNHGQCSGGGCGCAGGEACDSGRLHIARMLVGAFLLVLTWAGLFPEEWSFYGYALAYVVVGVDVVWKALKHVFAGDWFDEFFLMSIASLGAFTIGEYPEGVAVMLFYQVGEYFQEKAVRKSRKSIADMMDIRPDMARLYRDGKETILAPSEVHVGDEIVIKAGDRIPLDGVVIEGKAGIDTSALTGESVPRTAHVGDKVLSGSINTDGLLHVRVTGEYGDSTVARILEMVQSASEHKAPVENFITSFSRYYTPAVILLAIMVATIHPLLMGGAWHEWINRALVLLVVSCPCALVLSVPLSFFVGIGRASAKGILVKGGNYLEALSDVDTVVFDKTGTLTEGVFDIVEISASPGVDREEMLALVAGAESASTHAIARSVMRAYGHAVDKGRVSDYREISGKGIRATVDGKSVLVGNAGLMADHNVACDDVQSTGTLMHVAIDGRYSGYLIASDRIKQDSRSAVEGLRKSGVERIVVLTGDLEHIGQALKKELDIDEVRSELLPDEKVRELDDLFETRRTKGSVVFVGDGLNDAPVLAKADVGVAMGGLGADAAIEAADVVLMTDEPSRLVSAIGIARLTKKLASQNIVLSLGVKGVVLALGVAGIATMWAAVFADVGVALLAILNSLRKR